MSFNVKTETIKVLKENLVEKPFGLAIIIIFCIWYQKYKQHKHKSVSGTTLNLKALHTKQNNIQNEKATYETEENVCKAYIGKRINTQNM